MIKSLFLLVSFCVLISLQSFFVTAHTKLNTVYSVTSKAQQDTLKKAADAQIKALAAQKKAAEDQLKKLAAQKKAAQAQLKVLDSSKTSLFNKIVVKPLKAIVKPFQFRANEKVRITKVIHGYIFKDSLAATQQSTAAAKQIKGLTDSLLLLQKHLTTVVTQPQLNKLLDSIKKEQQKADAIAAGKITPAPVKPATTDTPAKEKNGVPVIASANTSLVPKPEDVKAQQAKLNLIRRLYKGNITITDTAKTKDTVHIKELSLGHKTKVFGFYADTSHSDIRALNFKLLTSLVYATNQIDGAAENKELGNNIAVIDSAKKARCKIVLSMYNNSAASTTKFLNSNSAKNSLITRSLRLLNQYNADGININFNGLTAHQKGYFVTFIASLYKACMEGPKKFKISINVPADDKGIAYDVEALDKYTTSFIIDFSGMNQSPGPLAPLNNGSNHSIETCFALYLDQDVLASKFVLGVSYRGVVWQNQPQKFLHYISYTSIRTNYSDATVIYNKGESAAHIEADYKHTYIDIWYDDEKTLAEKYDYALNNGLGGIAIKSLGDDNGYGELQQTLAYKLLKVDTTIVGHIVIKHNFGTALSDFLILLVTNPCGQRINPDYIHALFLINLVIIVVLLAGSGFLFYQVKKNGEAWEWRKKLIYALMGLFALWMIVLLMWLFFWEKNPFFGPSAGKHNSEHCINISFITLFVILVLGVLSGVFIRWVYQLNNSDDKP